MSKGSHVVTQKRVNATLRMVQAEQDVSHMLRDDTITIQVADQKKFNLPATGSWSRLILGFSGGILIGLAVIIYLLQKRRKEGKAS